MERKNRRKKGNKRWKKIENDIKIPNEERCGNEDEGCIYGTDYYNLEDKIAEILDNYIRRRKIC